MTEIIAEFIADTGFDNNENFYNSSGGINEPDSFDNNFRPGDTVEDNDLLEWLGSGGIRSEKFDLEPGQIGLDLENCLVYSKILCQMLILDQDMTLLANK
ncbi:hypothetical protein J2X97_002955 [Epilithonimonas hungarica]|uniref:hypothetical protein n=1 Tax=Epilithonimonas hungarica TaxID=454006 RepID=UPI00277F2998|nr:hypothetical protein [Epilithonimonas hungarica]MDP9957289.1 hypothetical protein [Epilithonimonas hungarica]